LLFHFLTQKSSLSENNVSIFLVTLHPQIEVL